MNYEVHERSKNEVENITSSIKNINLMLTLLDLTRLQNIRTTYILKNNRENLFLTGVFKKSSQKNYKNIF